MEQCEEAHLIEFVDRVQVLLNRELGTLDDHQYKIAVEVNTVWCLEEVHHGTSMRWALLFVLRCLHTVVCLDADEAVDNGLALCIDISRDRGGYRVS